jgi:hypothetical protein
MLNVPMDVYTKFNVFKITYVCTSVYDKDDQNQVGKIRTSYVITTDEEQVYIWFRGEFNCSPSGNLYDLLDVEPMTQFAPAHFDMMHYLHLGRERAEEMEHYRRME